MELNIMNVNAPLFEGITPEERKGMLGCIGYHVASFRKVNTPNPDYKVRKGKSANWV